MGNRTPTQETIAAPVLQSLPSDPMLELSESYAAQHAEDWKLGWYPCYLYGTPNNGGKVVTCSINRCKAFADAYERLEKWHSKELETNNKLPEWQRPYQYAAVPVKSISEFVRVAGAVGVTWKDF